MNYDNGQKSGKTVQTLITSKKSIQKDTKGRHRRESKNAKQNRNTKQNCF